MRRVALVLSSVAVLAASSAWSAPSWSADPTPTEFRKQLDAADRAFGEGSYLAAVERLRDGMQIANQALRMAVVEVLPVPPAGLVPVAIAEPAPSHNDPIAATFATTAIRPIERRYASQDGASTLRTLVAPNAPSVSFVQQQIRQAESDDRFAAIVVGDVAGVLVRSAPTIAVRFAVAGRHLLEIQATGIQESALLRMVDERTLQRLAAALGQ
ncbi:MAG: hypothetical protein HZB39_18695 [Planctomycetes bacterium]|nr:hypothetical protein [Planctomycetota bacterium]